MTLDHVFGYGSLISSESRARTGRSGAPTPARVRGFQRAWNFPYLADRMTALGAVPREGAVINGVFLPIPPGELVAFDEREEGYARVPVRREGVFPMGPQEPPEGALWIYVPVDPCPPTAECPILQSYVDVVMTGCLEFGESFAAEFVRTTVAWGYPRENDRSSPRYRRALLSVPLARDIDRILVEQGVPL